MIRVKIIKETKRTETKSAQKHRQKSNRFKPEWQKEYPSNQPGYETPSERFKRIFGQGARELMSFARGILQEDALLAVLDELELEELNQNHDADGLFSNEKNATCKSSYFVDKVRKRKGGALKNKSQSGRGPTKSGQGKYRCRDNSPKWQAESQNQSLRNFNNCSKYEKDTVAISQPTQQEVVIPQTEEGKLDTYQVARVLRKKQKELSRLTSIITKLSKRKDCKELTAKQLAIWIDAVNRAEKGKLTPTK